MIIGVRETTSKWYRQCENCLAEISPGDKHIRLYGAAFVGDPPFHIYLHIGCALKAIDDGDIELKGKLKKIGYIEVI